MSAFFILVTAITVVYMIYYPVMIYLDLTKRSGVKMSSTEEIKVEGASDEDTNDTFIVKESEDGGFATVKEYSGNNEASDGEQKELIAGGLDVPADNDYSQDSDEQQYSDESGLENNNSEDDSYFNSDNDDVYTSSQSEEDQIDEVPVDEDPSGSDDATELEILNLDEPFESSSVETDEIDVSSSEAEESGEDNDTPENSDGSHPIREFIEEMKESLEPAEFYYFGEMTTEQLINEIKSGDTDIKVEKVYDEL